ncbi:MAG TPA: MarR family transcriptional regulator [Acidimicrobiales bacterium]|nr:MarR family transcriptional regulator [Acidimicrobiales bacterium]
MTAPLTVESPALDALSTSMQAYGRMVTQGRVIEAVLKRTRIDLSRADVGLMKVLRDSGVGVRPGDLADRLGVDAPTVTRRVQQLEARHLVRRTADPLDRRAQLVQLTASGNRLIERAMAAFHEWLETVLFAWKESDREQLAELLARFVDDCYANLECHGR